MKVLAVITNPDPGSACHAGIRVPLDASVKESQESGQVRL
jgi:hypothetical protein